MPWWTCEECENRFKRNRSGNRPVRFCGQICFHSWMKEHRSYRGTFSKGNRPWNHGLKGTHFSPNTEFKKGRESQTRLPIGTVRIRRRPGRRNDTRQFIKTGEPNVWTLMAVKVWTDNFGEIPRGCVTHHLDHNPLNDDITNIMLLSRAAHMNEHRDKIAEAARRSPKRNGWGPGGKRAERRIRDANPMFVEIERR